MSFQAAYLPIGVGTFHMESASDQFERSKRVLKEISEDIVCPEEMLLDIGKLNSFLKTVEPDLLIIQNLTFANAAYTGEILHAFPDVPVLLWTLREPVIDGGRLRLNALTGAFSAANTIREFKDEEFEFVYGGPEEAQVKETLEKTVKAAVLKKKMKDLSVCAIGHTPQGFGFGRALDNDLLKVFGVRQEAVEARELIDKTKSYSDEECREYLEDALKRTVGLENTPERNRLDFARIYKAYAEFVKEHNTGAIASRCWPDFFTSFGTPVCAVLAMLNDLGVSAACETDMYGALSMWIGQQFSGKPVFFGDPVSLDEKENTITFWHCGTAACSLARKDTGACIVEHYNRHIGPTMEFGCEESDHAVIFRIHRDKEGKFSFYLAEGEALDRPKQFFGTSSVIRLKGNAEKLIYSSVQYGMEPHYVVVYGDVAGEITILGHMLGLEVRDFS